LKMLTVETSHGFSASGGETHNQTVDFAYGSDLAPLGLSPLR